MAKWEMTVATAEAVNSFLTHFRSSALSIIFALLGSDTGSCLELRADTILTNADPVALAAAVQQGGTVRRSGLSSSLRNGPAALPVLKLRIQVPASRSL